MNKNYELKIFYDSKVYINSRSNFKCHDLKWENAYTSLDPAYHKYGKKQEKQIKKMYTWVEKYLKLYITDSDYMWTYLFETHRIL